MARQTLHRPYVHDRASEDCEDRESRGPEASRGLRGAGRGGRIHRAQGLDARSLSPHADAADQPACAFGDRRNAAGGQLDHACAVASAQGNPARQGAGRGRAWAISLLRGRDARHEPRADDRGAAQRQSEILDHLQLSDAHLGGHRRDRLAGRRRGDHEPSAAAAHESTGPTPARWCGCARKRASTSARATRS